MTVWISLTPNAEECSEWHNCAPDRFGCLEHPQPINEAFKARLLDLPGGPVVKNPPANVGDSGSIPGPGRLHMLQSI